MRPIKFRAWEKVIEEYGEKYGGEMFYSEECDAKRSCGFVINTNSGFSNNDFIWMQYTGLKDMTGKEVYEGDIIVDDSDNVYSRVIWNDVTTSFERIKGLSNPRSFFLKNTYTESVRVIGNIYENPELVEEDS